MQGDENKGTFMQARMRQFECRFIQNMRRFISKQQEININDPRAEMIVRISCAPHPRFKSE